MQNFKKIISIVTLAAVIITLFTGCAKIADLAGKVKNKVFGSKTTVTETTSSEETTSAGDTTTASETTTEQEKKPTSAAGSNRKKMTVALNATMPPYEFYYGDEVIGIDVDIAKKIADELNMDLAVKDVPFDDVFDTVSEKEADFVMSAVTATDYKGNSSYYFSDVYYTDTQSLVARRADEKAKLEINTIDDLNGLRIGVLSDSSSEFYAQYYFESSNIVLFDNYNELFSGLVNGSIEAVVARYEDAQRYLANIPDLRFLDKELKKSEFRAASTDMELIKKINNIIAKMSKDGTVKEIEKYYYDTPKYK